MTIADRGVHEVGSLTIQTNGVLTHLANGTTTAQGERYKVILNIAGDLTIDAGGSIEVNGKGYSAWNGPGKQRTSNVAGAGHGGVGGRGSLLGAGTTYGCITAPTNIGSSLGGGAIILTVHGTTTLQGALLAKAAQTSYQGSGGSVFLTTGALTGNGTIDVGVLDSVKATASGGGGRIAVILTNSTDFGNVQMRAFSASCNYKNGAGGTIYLERKGDSPGHGKLIVDYGDVIPGDRTACFTLQNGVADSSCEFSEIVLTNGGVYAVDSNDTLTITGTVIQGDPTDRFDGLYLAGGTLAVPATFGWTNTFIGVGATNSTFTPTAGLTVGTNATLKIDAPFTLNGPITVLAGGDMDHMPNDTNELCKLELTLHGDLDIQAGAAINLDGLGYINDNGPGKGGWHAGAGHGGAGGYHTIDTVANRGAAYGSITAPTNIGSGGDSSAGGGVAILTVHGATTLNGAILARAPLGTFQGSGGSVFLTTGTLTGNGTIDAGVVAGSSAAGGGGRISVILTNGNDFGGIEMSASSVSTYYGQGSPGTIYTQTKDQGSGCGTLVIDAGSVAPAAVSPTLINSNVTDTAVGTVVIANKAILQIETNRRLTVNGSWTNAATVVADPDSTVEFAGAHPATIAGSNTFWNLTITNAGKTVSFEAGKTNTINGLLTLGTTAGDSTVTLQSTSANDGWFITLAPGGDQAIKRVTVTDSHADGGQELLAGKGSVDGGHNVNWLFPKSDGTMILVR